MSAAASDYVLARDLPVSELTLGKKENPVTGQDGNTYGANFWIESTIKHARRFRIEHVTFRAIRPSGVPKDAVPDRFGRLTDGSFKPWDKLSLAVVLDVVHHAADIARIQELEQKLVTTMFDRKASLFTNAAYIANTIGVEAQFGQRFIRPQGVKADGSEQAPTMYLDVNAWGDKVIDAYIQSGSSNRGGRKISNTYVSSCRFAARVPGEKLPAKSTPTIFKVRVGGGKTTSLVPWREDGSYDNFESHIKTDAEGKPLMRLVGPGDLTDGSIGDIYVDPVGLNINNKVKAIRNALVVEFDRADPSKARSPASLEDEEDDNTASAAEVFDYFRQLEEKARAAAAPAEEKALVSNPLPTVTFAPATVEIKTPKHASKDPRVAPGAPPRAPRRTFPEIDTLDPDTTPPELGLEDAGTVESDEEASKAADVFFDAVSPLAKSGTKRRAEQISAALQGQTLGPAKLKTKK